MEMQEYVFPWQARSASERLAAYVRQEHKRAVLVMFAVYCWNWWPPALSLLELFLAITKCISTNASKNIKMQVVGNKGF